MTPEKSSAAPKDKRPGIANPLDWTATERALLLMAASLFYVMIAGIVFALVPITPLREVMDLRTTAIAERINWSVGGAWTVMVLAAVWKSRRDEDPRWVIRGFVHTWTIYILGTAYAVGFFTTPFLLMIASGIFIGLLLLDARFIREGIALGLLISVGLTVAERFGWIPYAPLLSGPPYDEHGALHEAWMTLLIIMGTIYMLGFWRVSDWLVLRWQEREAKFRELSAIDALTHLPNRRRLMEVFEAECARAERQDQPISVLVCDADHFKRINDSYGHEKGDRMLEAIANGIRSSLRDAVDLPARIGGEEFAVLLPNTDTDDALAVAERIRSAVADRRIETHDGPVGVTMSVGVVTGIPPIPAPEVLLREADRALYVAKENGRDRAHVAAQMRISRMPDTPPPW